MAQGFYTTIEVILCSILVTKYWRQILGPTWKIGTRFSLAWTLNMSWIELIPLDNEDLYSKLDLTTFHVIRLGPILLSEGPTFISCGEFFLFSYLLSFNVTDNIKNYLSKDRLRKSTYLQSRISTQKHFLSKPKLMLNSLLWSLSLARFSWNSLRLEIGNCHRRYSSIQYESMHVKNSTQTHIECS